MRVRLSRLAMCGLCLMHAPWVTADAPQPDATRSAEVAIDLPMTVDNLWYRSGGKKRSGYLIVSDDGLEFVAKKKTFQIPLDRLRFIDFGPMGGDVDTDWVVLTVGVKAPYDLIGIRDGSHWGFGKRTRTIHANLLRAMRSFGAAQYSAASGSRAFQTQDLKCAFEFPKSWHVLVESSGVGRSASGEVLFSAVQIRTLERDESGRMRSVDDYEMLDAVNAGERAGFRVRQTVAERGMSCKGFSRSVQRRMTEEFAQRISAAGLSLVGELERSPANVGDCDALRWIGRARDGQERLVTLETHAVAKNGRLYFLSLREVEGAHGARSSYENAVRTLRLGGALEE